MVGGVLCFVLLLPSLVRIYHSERLFLSEDTREISYQWAMKNIPGGTKIAIDSTGAVFPDLPQKKEMIKESREKFKSPKFDSPKEAIDFKTKLVLENPYYQKKVFYIYYLKTGPSKDRFLKTYPEVYLDINTLEHTGIQYVFISTILLNHSGKSFLADLKERADLIVEFNPYKDKTGQFASYDETIVPCAPFSLKELTRRERTGPVIQVYKLRQSK